LTSNELNTTSKLVLLPPQSYNHDVVKRLLQDFATRRLCRQNARRNADGSCTGNVSKSKALCVQTDDLLAERTGEESRSSSLVNVNGGESTGSSPVRVNGGELGSLSVRVIEGESRSSTSGRVDGAELGSRSPVTVRVNGAELGSRTTVRVNGDESRSSSSGRVNEKKSSSSSARVNGGEPRSSTSGRVNGGESRSSSSWRLNGGESRSRSSVRVKGDAFSTRQHNSIETLPASLHTTSMQRTVRSLNQEREPLVNGYELNPFSNPFFYNILLGAIEPPSVLNIRLNQEYIGAWMNQWRNRAVPGYDYLQQGMLNLLGQGASIEEMFSRSSWPTSVEHIDGNLLRTADLIREVSMNSAAINGYLGYDKPPPWSMGNALHELYWPSFLPMSVFSFQNSLLFGDVSSLHARCSQSSAPMDDFDGTNPPLNEGDHSAHVAESKLSANVRLNKISPTLSRSTFSPVRTSSRNVTRSMRSKLFWATGTPRKPRELPPGPTSVTSPPVISFEGTNKRKRPQEFISGSNGVHLASVTVPAVTSLSGSSIYTSTSTALAPSNGVIRNGEVMSSIDPTTASFADRESNDTSFLPLLSSTLTLLASRPGWFGKGLCIKKLKRRKSKQY